MTRAVLLHPPADVVASMVGESAKSQLYLVPQDVSVEQPRRFRELMVTAGMYLVALAAFLTLMLYAFGATATVVMQREVRALVIRRMCGATPAGLVVRIASFLAAVMLVLPAVTCGVLVALGPPVRTGALAALVIVSVCWLGILTVSCRRVLSERFLSG